MAELHEDRAWLTAFRQGDPEALTRVFSVHYPRIKKLLHRGFVLESAGAQVTGLSDPEALKDALQETFARAFAERARLAYDGLTPYHHYLSRIAKNLLIDLYRKARSSQKAFEAIGRDLEGETRLLDPIDELPDQRRRRDLARAFCQALDEPHRTLYALRYREELPLVEVARRMGITRKKARVIEAQLRQRLAEQLAAQKLAPTP